MRNARRLISLLGLVVALIGPIGAPSAGADGDDHLDLVSLTTRPLGAGTSGDSIPFQAVVDYRLQSVPEGFLLVFLFENGQSSSTRQSSESVPVKAGSGRINLNINYTLKSGVRSLTLTIGLFKSQQNLLSWVGTTPIDVTPWPGRAAFEKAMAARQAEDYPAADQYLSAAIDASPDTGNYYYWRGDTRTYLSQYAAAIADFGRSIALMPDDLASRVGRGIALLWNGDAASAVEDLNFAIDRSASPDRATAFAYRARGTAFAALGQPTRAIADYQAYLALQPDATDRAEVEGWIADLN